MIDQLARRPLLDEQWELAAMVAIRPEPFGALAYHFGTRRLTFLKRPQLSEVVRMLGSSDDVRAALVAADVPTLEWDAYGNALEALADAGMIRRRATDDGAR